MVQVLMWRMKGWILTSTGWINMTKVMAKCMYSKACLLLGNGYESLIIKITVLQEAWNYASFTGRN